ncbi:MAG: hypothetical protein H6738_03895 [Alphaproteobacteria bacterium]|nr:hypothetical protein [Alphaproteobacteria bacterium]MCB9695912.1 hypothetical protein [Alphaproteobacteria bacterium]
MDPSARAHVWLLDLDTAAAFDAATPFAEIASHLDHGLLAAQHHLLPDLDPAALARMEQGLYALVDHFMGHDHHHDHGLFGGEDLDHHALTDLHQAQAELAAQQQLYATMSHMSAMQHQTSMAIIDNMSGGPDYNHNGYIDWSE